MAEQPKPYQVRPHTVGSAYVCQTCQHNHVSGCSYGAINTTGGQHACPNFVEHVDVPIPSSRPISPPSPAETPNRTVHDPKCSYVLYCGFRDCDCVPPTETQTATPDLTLRCGHCGFAPNHPAAQLGEICVKCGCDGYRLPTTASTPSPTMPSAPEPR